MYNHSCQCWLAMAQNTKINTGALGSLIQPKLTLGILLRTGPNPELSKLNKSDHFPGYILSGESWLHMGPCHRRWGVNNLATRKASQTCIDHSPQSDRKWTGGVRATLPVVAQCNFSAAFIPSLWHPHFLLHVLLKHTMPTIFSEKPLLMFETWILWTAVILYFI